MLRELWTLFVRPNSIKIALVAFASAVCSALGLRNPVGIAVALAVLVGDADGSAVPPGSAFDLNTLGSRVLERWVLPLSDSTFAIMLIVGIGYLAHTVCVASLEYTVAVMAMKVRATVAQQVQLRVVRHILALSVGFFHEQKTGDLMSRLTQDAMNTGQGLGPLVRSVIHHGTQLLGFGV